MSPSLERGRRRRGETRAVQGAECVVTIANQGQQIDEHWIYMIFDEFAVRDVKHHHKGQGLSMAISRHIMELHGGSVQVQNIDDGVMFTIRLPMQREKSAGV